MAFQTLEKSVRLSVMKASLTILLLPVLLFADMLTPAYYSGELKKEADIFLAVCHAVKMHHPLENKKGRMPDYTVPFFGTFGAGKGPTRTGQHHPATDLKIDGGETDVELFAAHDGVISTVRDAPKYRHFISITKIITDGAGNELGKLVTLYGHVDLDLDEEAGLKLDGQTVKQGELISKNLYSGTMGGPHLHFEIRYYRPGDDGTEEFYSFKETVPGTGDWPYGFWSPVHGFGFGEPESHGLNFK
jgi:murein DD-endopeptidase MepM/ murein hydrolase activator NlpD